MIAGITQMKLTVKVGIFFLLLTDLKLNSVGLSRHLSFSMFYTTREIQTLLDQYTLESLPCLNI